MHPVSDRLTNGSRARRVGFILAAIGLGLGWHLMIVVWRQLGHRSVIEVGALVFVCTVVPIAWFCTAAGLRLAFNRQNRYGSVVGPWTWRVLAMIFLLVSIAFVLIAAMQENLLFVVPAIGAISFAILSVRRARMLGHLVLGVLPSNTSLERTRER
jgi:hypothetical protein